MPTSVVFTRISANRVKVSLDGKIMGLSLAGTNIFEHPTLPAIILTRESSPKGAIDSGNSLIITAADVTTPTNTDKTDLVTQLSTTYFN